MIVPPIYYYFLFSDAVHFYDLSQRSVIILNYQKQNKGKSWKKEITEKQKTGDTHQVRIPGLRDMSLSGLNHQVIKP